MSRFLPSFRAPPAFCALDTSSRLLVLTLTGGKQDEETQIRKSLPTSRTGYWHWHSELGNRAGGGGLGSHLWAAEKSINALVPRTIPLLFGSGFISRITTKLSVCHPQLCVTNHPFSRLIGSHICRQILISGSLFVRL